MVWFRYLNWKSVITHKNTFNKKGTSNIDYTLIIITKWYLCICSEIQTNRMSFVATVSIILLCFFIFFFFFFFCVCRICDEWNISSIQIQIGAIILYDGKTEILILNGFCKCLIMIVSVYSCIDAKTTYECDSRISNTYTTCTLYMYVYVE